MTDEKVERKNILEAKEFKDDIEIEWDGKKAHIKLRKLNFGEMMDVVRQCIEVKSDNRGSMQVQVKDVGLYMELLTVKSIESAPFNVDINTIKKLPAEVGMAIFTAAQELSPLALA